MPQYSWLVFVFFITANFMLLLTLNTGFVEVLLGCLQIHYSFF